MGVGTMGYPELPPAQAFLSPYARQQTNRGNPISDSPPPSLSPLLCITLYLACSPLMCSATVNLSAGCRAWNLERLR